MTLDELVKTFRAGLFGHLGENPYATVGEGDMAGVKAVVMALRDEADEYHTARAVTEMLNAILASDDVKAAGGGTNTTVLQYSHPKTSDAIAISFTVTGGGGSGKGAPAAAPDVCEWTIDGHPDYGSHFDTACGDGWNLLNGDPASDGYKFCPSCGKPIEFKEGSE